MMTQSRVPFNEQRYEAFGLSTLIGFLKRLQKYDGKLLSVKQLEYKHGVILFEVMFSCQERFDVD